MIRWAILLTCVACHGSLHVPLTLRPDTRGVSAVTLPGGVLSIAAKHVLEAYPNEVALCLHGSVRDSVMNGESRRVAVVERVSVSPADSADLYHVFFSLNAQGRCGAHIGQAHSHTQLFPTMPCTHSHADVNVLFEDLEAVFSLVLCIDGRAEVLLQDGRRMDGRWAE